MNDVTSIAIDVMSGDLGPEVTVLSSLQFASQNPSIHLILVGLPELVPQLIAKYSKDALSCQNVSFHPATEVVLMDEKPSHALRKKQHSSMAVSLQLVKSGEAQGAVSAGNTGALMILSRSILRMLPGIDRPAIAKELVTPSGKCVFLDLGANVDSSAEQLYQFAIMGSIYSSSVGEVQNPEVALLNVGEEDIKGNEQVKLTARLLAESSYINFMGYVEGDQIFSGNADVIVCDGFVGNIALKCGEGVIGLLRQVFASKLSNQWWYGLLGWAVRWMLKPIFESINPDRHNGASFLGVQGVVVKSHGNAGVEAFQSAIHQAVKEVEHQVPEKINSKLDEWLI